MNSNQRRKLEAMQHNDKRRYEKWLRENAIYTRVDPIVAMVDRKIKSCRGVSVRMLMAQAVILGLY